MQPPLPLLLPLLTQTSRVYFTPRLIRHTEANRSLPSSRNNSITRHNLSLSNNINSSSSSNNNSSNSNNNKLRINKPLSSHKLDLVKCFITQQG
jgi:hypothetical protein